MNPSLWPGTVPVALFRDFKIWYNRRNEQKIKDTGIF